LSSYNYTHHEYENLDAVPFKTLEVLGKGSLAYVEAVRRKDNSYPTPLVLARKVIHVPPHKHRQMFPIVRQEVEIMRSLCHQHIVSVVGSYETLSPRRFCILMSPVGDEDLSRFMERVAENDFPSEDLGRLQGWFVCLASAVAYVHTKLVRHKDIKPQNIICKGNDVFLTDFGSAHQFVHDLASSTEGAAGRVTLLYSPREVHEEGSRGRSADIFSLGCVFTEMGTVICRRETDEFHKFRSEAPNERKSPFYTTQAKIENWFANLAWSPFHAVVTHMLADEAVQRPSAKDVASFFIDQVEYFTCDCILI